MINIFGKDHDVVGSQDRDLILKTNGKIKIQMGKKFIDLLDLKGNINAPTKNPISSAKTPEEVSSSGQGFYIVDGNLFVNVDGQVIQITGLEQLYLKYKEAQKLNQSEIDIVQKNIGFKFDTIEEAQKTVTKGIINIKGDLYYLQDEEEPKKLNLDLTEPLSVINETGLGLPTGDCFIAYIDGRWCYCPLKNYGETKVTSFVTTDNGNTISVVNTGGGESGTSSNNGTTRGMTSESSEDQVVTNSDLPIDFAPLWYSKQYYIKNAEFEYTNDKKLFIKNLITVPTFIQFPDDEGIINIQLIKVDLAGIAKDDNIENPKQDIPIFKYNKSYSSYFHSFNFLAKEKQINNAPNERYLELSDNFEIFKGVFFDDDFTVGVDTNSSAQLHIGGSGENSVYYNTKYVSNVYEQIEKSGVNVLYIVDYTTTNEVQFYILGQTNNNPLVGNSIFMQAEFRNSAKLRRGIGAKLVIEENFPNPANSIKDGKYLNPIVYMGNLSDTEEYFVPTQENPGESSPPFNTYHGKYITGIKSENINEPFHTVTDSYGLYSKQAVFNGLEIRGKWPREVNFDIADLPRYSVLLSNYLQNYIESINTEGLSDGEKAQLLAQEETKLKVVMPDINWIKTKFLSEPLKAINETGLGTPTQNNVFIGWKDGAWKYLPIETGGNNSGNSNQAALSKAINAQHILGTIQFYPVTLDGNTIITCIPSGLALCDGKNGTSQVSNLTITNGITLAYVQSIEPTYIQINQLSNSFQLNTEYSISGAINFLDYALIDNQYYAVTYNYSFNSAQGHNMKFYYKSPHYNFRENNYAYSSGSFENFPAYTIYINNKITWISVRAFKGTGAREITLPDSVTGIGDYALDTGDSYLTIKIYAKTPPTLGVGSIPSNVYKIIVPTECLSIYRNNSQWGSFNIQDN